MSWPFQWSFILVFSPKCYMHSSSPHSCYMPWPSHEVHYVFIINCNWVYARWQCLQRPYIQQGNSTYISQIQHNTSYEFSEYNTSTWTLQNTAENSKYRRKQEIKQINMLPGKEPGPSSQEPGPSRTEFFIFLSELSDIRFICNWINGSLLRGEEKCLNAQTHIFLITGQKYDRCESNS
jgi:hypothetical protein